MTKTEQILAMRKEFTHEDPVKQIELLNCLLDMIQQNIDYDRKKRKQVKNDQRKLGKFLGGARPFGYQIDKDNFLIPDNEEQEIINRILACNVAGFSLRRITRIVATDKHPISFKTVHRIIKRSGGQDSNLQPETSKVPTLPS